MTLEAAEVRELAADFLRDVARVLREKGWEHGHLRGVNDEVCLVGAIVYATAPPSLAATKLATDTLRSVVGTRCLVCWNDAPERTEPEVFGALRTAIAHLRESKP